MYLNKIFSRNILTRSPPPLGTPSCPHLCHLKFNDLVADDVVEILQVLYALAPYPTGILILSVYKKHLHSDSQYYKVNITITTKFRVACTTLYVLYADYFCC